jgi:hypothetical protein
MRDLIDRAFEDRAYHAEEFTTLLGAYPKEYCRYCGKPIVHATYCSADCRARHRAWGETKLYPFTYSDEPGDEEVPF